jgi:MFS family permease
VPGAVPGVAFRANAPLLVGILCAAEILSMAAFSTYPALLPEIRDAWGLSNTAAGLIGGAFFVGYMAGVPGLAALTDRVDARRVYVASALVSAAAALGFATFASGLGSALLWQALAGAGLAGTYMPGVKLLADRIEGPTQSRAVAFYTSSFGIGASLSLWLAGALGAWGGVRWAFGLAAAGPAAAAVVVSLSLRPVPGALGGASETGAVARVLAVARNARARRFMLAYAAHCWELFGLRAWLVAFFTFAASRPGTGTSLVAPATAAAAINLLGPAASILGNEGALRVGRERWVRRAMLASAVLACAVGFASRLPWPWMMALAAGYFLAVMADSATLTAGVVAVASPGQRGTTMAVYSLAGFAAASVAPIAFGAVVDAAGGQTRELAWVLAFASLALPTALVWPQLATERGEGTTSRAC